MNQFVFNRSTGSLGPGVFARLHTTQRIHSIQANPNLRFDGGEKEIAPDDGEKADTFVGSGDPKIWAHQAGANALAIDIEQRTLISGGADSSIKAWDLDSATHSNNVLRPIGEVGR